MRTLVIIRGPSGNGKTTFAETLGFPYFEADQYFMKSGQYNFDCSKLKYAHEECRQNVENEMIKGTEKISVSNTFTKEWEMQPYFDLAKKYNYQVFSIIIEKRHSGNNAHNVPEDKINAMRERFEIKI